MGVHILFQNFESVNLILALNKQVLTKTSKSNTCKTRSSCIACQGSDKLHVSACLGGKHRNVSKSRQTKIYGGQTEFGLVGQKLYFSGLSTCQCLYMHSVNINQLSARSSMLIFFLGSLY